MYALVFASFLSFYFSKCIVFAYVNIQEPVIFRMQHKDGFSAKYSLCKLWVFLILDWLLYQGHRIQSFRRFTYNWGEVGGRTDGFIPFRKLLAGIETKTASSRIWTNSIFFDGNVSAWCTSMNSCSSGSNAISVTKMAGNDEYYAFVIETHYEGTFSRRFASEVNLLWGFHKSSILFT